jgi:hypothetical protein
LSPPLYVPLNVLVKRQAIKPELVGSLSHHSLSAMARLIAGVSPFAVAGLWSFSVSCDTLNMPWLYVGEGITVSDRHRLFSS